MSYDIDFILIDPKTDALSEARLRSLGEQLLSSPADDELRRSLVSDILSLHPTFRMEPHHQGFACGCWIGGDDENCPYPDIHVGVRSAFVAISYANDSDIMQQLLPLYDVFTKHGYVAYDPQTDALWLPERAHNQFDQTQSALTELTLETSKNLNPPEQDTHKKP